MTRDRESEILETNEYNLLQFLHPPFPSRCHHFPLRAECVYFCKQFDYTIPFNQIIVVCGKFTYRLK